MTIRKLCYLALGMTGLALGALGAVLPLLPAFPFLLLAAWGFGKSSDRLDRWFKGTRLYRDNLADLAAGRGPDPGRQAPHHGDGHRADGGGVLDDAPPCSSVRSYWGASGWGICCTSCSGSRRCPTRPGNPKPDLCALPSGGALFVWQGARH